MTTLISAGVMVVFLAAAAAAQEAEWLSKIKLAQQAETGGRYLDAVTLYQQAATVAAKFGPRDQRTWGSYNSLAMVYEEAGFPADALRTHRHTIELIKSAIGKQNAIYARMLANLGTVYLENGYFASAATTLREALQIEQRLSHPDSVEIAEMQSRMGEVLARQGHYAEADRMLGLALPVLKDAGATAEEATTLGSLGMLRGLERRYAEAVDAISTQVATLETTFGPEHPRLLRPLNNLAVVYSQAGRMQEAGAAFRRAVAICEKQLPPGHPNHAALLTNYAVFLRRTGEKTQAKTVEAEARSLAHDNARWNGLGMTVDVSAFLSKK